MIYNTFKLNDAVTLSHIQTDRFKNASLMLSVTVPVDAVKTPLNSLLIPTAFRGTENYRDFRAFCCHAEELYASAISDLNGKTGDCQTVGLRASMLNDRYISSSDRNAGFSVLNGVVDMISELLLTPLFRAEDTETEKLNQINRIKSVQNDAYEYAKHRFRSIMFADEPFGLSLSGEIQQVEEITAGALAKRRAELIGSAPVEIFYCGNAEADRITELLQKKLLCGLCSKVPTACPTRVIRCAKQPKFVEESGQYRQGNLLIGFRTGNVLDDRGFYATELMNQIFGDGSTSKLFMNVREKKSLCYFCGSSYNEVKGFVVVGCGINNSDYQAALDEILFQLEELKNGHITEREMISAREAIANDCRSAEDHPSDYEDFGRVARLYGGPLTIEEYRKGIFNVTVDEVAQAARLMSLDTVYFLRGTLEGNADDD